MTSDVTEKTDERSIERRIADAFDNLTEGERRLARVVRQTRGNLSSFTAHELAARAEVSNATAARLFKRLGYASYGEARRQSRDQDAWGSPVAELAGKTSQAAQSFASHAAHDCRNLIHTAEAIPEAAFQEAVQILAHAATVHVVGYRNSMPLAIYARSLLSQMRPSVMLLPMAGMTIAEELAGLRTGDALFAIGFRRRPPLLREIMAVARQAGLASVLVTDDSAVGVARSATVTLRCQNTGYGMFDSYAAAVSVINYLGTATGRVAGPGAVDRLRRIEELHTQLGSFAPTQARSRRTSVKGRPA